MKSAANLNYNFRRIATMHPRQWLYTLGDEGLVYSEVENRFAGLDAAGILAYRAFDAGADIEDLRAVSKTSNFCPASEEALVTIYGLSRGVFPTERSLTTWPPLQSSEIANIEIHGLPIFLEHPDGPLGELCQDYFRNCLSTKREPAQYNLQARREGDSWGIDGNGRELLSSVRDEQLGLALLHGARSLLYARGQYDVAFHAAMVANDDCGVMLCAPRESGKSTLAAYLASSGFELVTDEPALLRVDTSSVSSLCLPFSLKEGSWAVLEQHWPKLQSGPVHVRSDGTKIRLLHPPEAHPPATPRRLTHLLFPKYRPSSPIHSEFLSPIRTLGLLNQGGMIFAEHLMRDTFEAFLRLICEVPSYTLRFDSLREAGRLICELILE